MLKAIIKRKYAEVAKLVKPNSKVLDVGCNEGELRNFIKPSLYIGIDVEEKNIKELKSKNIKSYLLNLNEYKILPTREKFNYIFFLDVLEHVVNPKKVLNDFKKLLTADGKIIVSLPNDYHIQNKIRFFLNKKLIEFPFWEYGHLHTFPINEGKKFLKEQGFQILKMKYLAPEKPEIIPLSIKKFLANNFSNNFARVVIYELGVVK